MYRLRGKEVKPEGKNKETVIMEWKEESKGNTTTDGEWNMMLETKDTNGRDWNGIQTVSINQDVFSTDMAFGNEKKNSRENPRSL